MPMDTFDDDKDKEKEMAMDIKDKDKDEEKEMPVDTMDDAFAVGMWDHVELWYHTTTIPYHTRWV